MKKIFNTKPIADLMDKKIEKLNEIKPILYGFDGQEILTHSKEDEAIESWLEDMLDDDFLPETIELNGYIRENVPADYAKHQADCALEMIQEHLMERYGYEDMIDLDADDVKEFHKVVERICTTFPSWCCEVFNTKTVDTKKWVEENCEEWINDGLAKWEE